VVHRPSETSTNQSDVSVRSDDQFLNIIEDLTNISCLKL